MQRGSTGDFRHTLAQLAWRWTWLLFFRTSPRWALNGWRRFLLRRFGARIGNGAIIRPSCRIWAPWNLSMGELACLADDVDCDCKASVTLGNKVTVSQYSCLLSANPDDTELGARPIIIEDHAWVAARACVGPGVRIGEGAVVGACSMVTEDVAPCHIVAGNPAKFIKLRPRDKWLLKAGAQTRPSRQELRPLGGSDTEKHTKVGIVTFHFADNYGAVLQTYALQKALQDVECDPVVIDYRPSYMTTGGFFRWPRSKKLFLANLRIAYIKINLLHAWVRGRARARAFVDFRRRYLCTTPEVYRTGNALRRSPPGCAVYVCGSDQVWNTTPRYGVDPVYYLDFAPASIRRVSYAASFGRADIDPEDWETTADLVKRLDCIAVREESGVQLVRRLCGRTAAWLPDPVLLYDDYSALAVRPPRNDFIFMYCFRASQCTRQIQRDVVDILQRPTVIPYESRISRNIFAATVSLSPLEWVGHIAQAHLVVTNSYHAMLFSIIFRRPFLMVAFSGDRSALNERAKPLLARLGLFDRMIPESTPKAELQRLLAKPIDWDGAHTQIAAWRAEAFAYLRANVRGW